MPKAGGPTQQYSGLTEPGGGIAVDATAVYWAKTPGHIFYRPLAGGGDTFVNVGSALSGIALSATDAYWAIPSGGIKRMPRPEGAFVTLVADTGQFTSSPVISDGYLYWNSFRGVGRVALSGGPTNWLTPPTGAPGRGVAVTADAIYVAIPPRNLPGNMSLLRLPRSAACAP